MKIIYIEDEIQCVQKWVLRIEWFYVAYSLIPLLMQAEYISLASPKSEVWLYHLPDTETALWMTQMTLGC